MCSQGISNFTSIQTKAYFFRYDYPNVMAIVWHPTQNIVSFTNSDGELYIFPDFVPNEHVSILNLSLQPAPLIHDPLAEVSGNRQPIVNSDKPSAQDNRLRLRRGTPDSLDDILGSEVMGDADF